MTNLLITGGLGHIGSQMIRELAKREDIETIRILDNFLTQRYCSLFNLSTEKIYQFQEGDITNPEEVAKAMEDIDVVIHLAAITDAPSTIKDPEGTDRVNYQGTLNVLEAATKAGVRKFLLPSTTSVFGEAEGVVDETTTDLRPQSPYAESKLKAEQAVQAAGQNGLDTTVLRMGTIFGTSVGMRFHTAVNKFTYLACMGKPLTVWDNALDHKRPYLGLKDCLRAFAFLEQNGKPGELYCVLTENYTVRNMIDTIKEFIPGLEVKLTPAPILNQKSYEVSDQKVRALGYTPTSYLFTEIEATIELFKAIRNE
ncbi:MAG: SDR family oxidoreductase [Nanoarchaeota archaeon]|nr:SDR family oxidoreductase [Nanoarchaeota archaeon]